MKIVKENDKEYKLSGSLNKFQQKMYIHLINWKWQNITPESGYYNGNEYDAILPDNMIKNDGSSPIIYPEIMSVLLNHLKKNPFRIHKHYYHMASSQAANVNLFLPILHNPDVNDVFRQLKPDFASLATEYLDNGFCVEYWGGNFNANTGTGLLGDKSDISGTDSDIAIAYYNHKNDLCLWLIEHKLTEAEFTVCGGYKSKGRKDKHDCSKSFTDLLKNKNSCYYHDVCNFKYWDITDDNQTFFTNHTLQKKCPFKGGMNQLWRNQILAMAIENSKSEPYQQVYFSVVKHPDNTYLDNTINNFKKLIDNNPKFSSFNSADVITAAKNTGNSKLLKWSGWYRELYRI